MVTCSLFICLFTALLSIQMCKSQAVLGTPPKVDGPPLLLDSFLPASMQIIAHLTELMKYDLKPQSGPSTTSTTTIRPTLSHKPGIYQPELPPGPEAYFAKGATYAEYVQQLKQPNGFNNYFDRYLLPNGRNIPLSYYNSGLQQQQQPTSYNQFFRNNNFNEKTPGDSSDYSIVYGVLPNNLDNYIGEKVTDVLKLVNRVENDFEQKDADNQVQDFSQTYDDSDFRFYLLKQKRVPPTKAYVSLLSLYDLLNKEAKKLGFNKYGGFSESVLRQLADASTGTSAAQLKFVLSKIMERNEITRPEILKKIKTLIDDLEVDNSYINVALRYIPPLPFVS